MPVCTPVIFDDLSVTDLLRKPDLAGQLLHKGKDPALPVETVHEPHAESALLRKKGILHRIVLDERKLHDIGRVIFFRLLGTYLGITENILAGGLILTEVAGAFRNIISL